MTLANHVSYSPIVHVTALKASLTCEMGDACRLMLACDNNLHLLHGASVTFKNKTTAVLVTTTTLLV